MFDILKQEGFRVIPARSNSIVARIAAVEAFLGRQIDGKPALLIDPGCRQAIRGMRGGYRYKTRKSGETEDTPEKNAYSHLADAGQYLCLHADGGRTFGGHQARRKAHEIVRAPTGGWT